MKNLRFRIIIYSLIVNFIFLILHCSSYALDVKRSVLPNGLMVLHVERHNLPIVMITMLVKASPFNESEDKAGLANLTAELLTEGTKKRNAIDISEDIEFIGASLNASVESDFTTINLSVLKRDVEKGFEIFSDILLNPVFPDDEITRNREMIKGSLKQSEEEPSFVAEKAFKKAVFGGHPYGRLVRGSIETIDSIKREDIVRFHSDFYRPNNAIISIVGDITEAEIGSLLNRFLSEWKPVEIPKRLTYQKTEKSKKMVLIDKDLTQANIILGHEGISRGNPDYYAVSVMNYILGGGGFSSRLMQAVREEKGLAYDIHSYFSAYKDGGYFQVGAQTKNASANEVISEVLSQIKRIREEGVSDKEIGDAKAYLTGSFPRKLDTNRKIADFLIAVEFYGLGPDYIKSYPLYINSINRDDILRVARKYLDPGKFTLVVVANQSKANISREDKKSEKK